MIKFIAVMAVAVLLPLFASANEEGGKEGKKGGTWACEADKDRLCGDIEPGDGRLVACLMEHEKELTGECAAMVGRKKKEEGKRKKNPGAMACEADMKRLCADVEPGDGRLIACMAAHEAELSEPCRAMTSKKKDEMKKWDGKKKERKEKKDKVD